jgi:hypothetical protein
LRWDDGAATVLTSFGVSLSAGDVMKVTAVGTAISVYQNDVFRGSVTSGTYATGAAGVYLYDDDASLDASIDDFLANDITPGGGGGGTAGLCLLMGVC